MCLTTNFFSRKNLDDSLLPHLVANRIGRAKAGCALGTVRGCAHGCAHMRSQHMLGASGRAGKQRVDSACGYQGRCRRAAARSSKAILHGCTGLGWVYGLARSGWFAVPVAGSAGALACVGGTMADLLG